MKPAVQSTAVAQPDVQDEMHVLRVVSTSGPLSTQKVAQLSLPPWRQDPGGLAETIKALHKLKSKQLIQHTWKGGWQATIRGCQVAFAGTPLET